MWIFSKYGFFSAVCARQGDGSHGQPVDPERMMVRARDQGHLEALSPLSEVPGGCRDQGVSGDGLRVPDICSKSGLGQSPGWSWRRC
jgi:hypothetical protein